MSFFLRSLMLVLCLMLTATLAVAAVYRWVDADGKVHFSDTPPAGVTSQEMALPTPDVLPAPTVVPAEAKAGQSRSAEEKPTTSRVSSEGANVEIYVTDWCPYCRKAESWFKSRGIPFAAYDIEKDSRAAQRKEDLSNAPGVPLVVICGKQIPGYSPMDFEEAMKGCR